MSASHRDSHSVSGYGGGSILDHSSPTTGPRPTPSTTLPRENEINITFPGDDYTISTSSLSDDDFFDIDIESYYANGNNACGFIPGAPAFLNTDGLSLDDIIATEYETSGRAELSSQER